MAKIAKNTSHYEYDLNRSPKNTVSKKTLNGFWRQSKLVAKLNLDNDTDTVADTKDILVDEDKATSANGWISPKEYYDKQAHMDANDSRSATNGFVQKKDDKKHSKFLYKNLYWWCEDLHNWCVYRVTCDLAYMNIFELMVWNGKDDWIPISGYNVDSAQLFSGLQNRYLDNKNLFGDCVAINRGKDIRLGLEFTKGPLTLNHGMLLSKTNTFSINDANQFQTKRWSTPKHITTDQEFTQHQYSVMTGANGETRFVVKFRNAITGDGLYLITQENYDEQNSPYTDTTSYNVNSQSADDRDKKRCCVDVYYKNGKDDSEGYIFEATQGKAAYRYEGYHFDEDPSESERSLFYMHAIDNSLDTPLTQKDKNEKVKTEADAEFYDNCRTMVINWYHHKYNHAQFKAWVWEKVFALYLIDSNGNYFSTRFIREALPDAWLPSLDDETSLDYKDVIQFDDGTKIYPIYVSLLDLLMIFKGLDPDTLRRAGWGNGNSNPATIPLLNWLAKAPCTTEFTRTYWENRNLTLLKKIYGVINQVSAQGWDDIEHKITDQNAFNNWINKSKYLTNYTTSDPIRIFYSSTDGDGNDKAGLLYLHEFGWYDSSQSEWGNYWNKWMDNHNDWKENDGWGHLFDMDTQNFDVASAYAQTDSYWRDTIGDASMFQRIAGQIVAKICGGVAGIVAIGANVATDIGYDVANFCTNFWSSGKNGLQAIGSLFSGDIAGSLSHVWDSLVDFSSAAASLISAAADTIKDIGQGIASFVTGGAHDKIILKYNYARFDAKMTPKGTTYEVSSRDIHYDMGDSWKEMSKATIESICGSLASHRDRMNASINNTNMATTFENGYKVDKYTANLREGISTGNPAVWRTATGQIMLSTFMIWGGKEGLIGGPDSLTTDQETGESWVSESGNYNGEKFINNLCQNWFGDGTDKTIDKHWLKEYAITNDELGNKNSLVLNSSLESGMVLEQKNNYSKSNFKISLKTYRPTIVTSTEQDNTDIAKKW